MAAPIVATATNTSVPAESQALKPDSAPTPTTWPVDSWGDNGVVTGGLNGNGTGLSNGTVSITNGREYRWREINGRDLNSRDLNGCYLSGRDLINRDIKETGY
jgi:hypothetical protein